MVVPPCTLATCEKLPRKRPSGWRKWVVVMSLAQTVKFFEDTPEVRGAVGVGRRVVGG